MEKLRLVYIFDFCSTPNWKIMTNNKKLILLKMNKTGCSPLDQMTTKRTGNMAAASVVQFLFKAVVYYYIQFLCDTKWFDKKMRVFLKRMRRVPNVCFSPGKLLHSTHWKTIKSLKFTETSLCQSLLHHLAPLHPGASAFRLNVQMSSETQNWQLDNFFLQSLKHLSPIRCRKFTPNFSLDCRI